MNIFFENKLLAFEQSAIPQTLEPGDDAMLLRHNQQHFT